MNSNYKRSIRVTPCRIMFGRESPYINLLQLIQFDSVKEEFTSSEEELSEAEGRDNLTDFDLCNFEDKRKVSRNIARESILRERVIQKRIFYAKVHHKRYAY